MHNIASSPRMKVLLFVTNADEAGAPRHVEGLARGLATTVDYTIVFGNPGPVSARLIKDGFRVHILGQAGSDLNLLRDFTSLRALLALIRAWKPDLIHCHSSKAGLLGRVAGLKTSTPILYTVHGWGWRGLPYWKRLLVWSSEKILSLSRRSYYIYVSQSVALEGTKWLSPRKQNGRIIYNGLPDLAPEPEARAQNEQLRVFMPARVSRAKDHETLCRAFDGLGFPARLILCGGGTDAPAFNAALKEWAPRRHPDIEVLGERSDVHALLNSADVMVLSSHFEALPLTVIEAMRAGKSIVATDVGGVRELIPSADFGYVISKANAAELQASLTKLRDRKNRLSMGQFARTRFLENFKEDLMLSRTLQFYIDITGDIVGSSRQA